MKYTIVDTDWYTPPAPGLDPLSHTQLNMPSYCIGVVAIISGPGKYDWKAYIGFGMGISKKADSQSIASNGIRLDKEVACAYFPHLNPKNFRT